MCLHVSVGVCVYVCFLRNIKQSAPVRINQMDTGPTPYKLGSFQGMKNLKSSSSLVCVLQPPQNFYVCLDKPVKVIIRKWTGIFRNL